MKAANRWIGNAFFFSIFLRCRWGPPSLATRESTHKQQLILILFSPPRIWFFLCSSFFLFVSPSSLFSGDRHWGQGVCGLWLVGSMGSIVLGLLLEAVEGNERVGAAVVLVCLVGFVVEKRVLPGRCHVWAAGSPVRTVLLWLTV